MAQFYDFEYEEGATTRMPSAGELANMLAHSFVGHESDYTLYINVLGAIGVHPPSRILDFGSSWGYGCFQLMRAGYDVIGYEIATRRARYAAERLGVRMIKEPAELCEPIDCLFSAHVMEHLPDPTVLWRLGTRLLKPGGTFIAFMPNGNAALEEKYGATLYHKLWGLVHPLLITPDHLFVTARRFGFDVAVYSSPYPLDVMTSAPAAKVSSLDGTELVVIGRRLCGMNGLSSVGAV